MASTGASTSTIESRATSFLFKALVCLALSVGVSGCAQSNATGTYLAKFTNGLARLQLVQSGDHTVTGEIDWAIYDTTGKLTSSSASAAGAIDGKSVNLTFKGNSFLSGVSTGSGELTWSGLTLTGDFNSGNLSTVNFVRADENQYQSELAEVQVAANAVVEARAAAEQRRQAMANRAEFIATVSTLTARLQKFDTAAAVQRWPEIEKSFLLITSNMEAKLAEERALSGDGNSYRRGQLSYSINQDDDATEQLHYNVQSLADSFNSTLVPLMGAAVRAKATCASMTGSDIVDTCKALLEAVNTALPRGKAFAVGLDHLELVYQQQHQKNQEIIHQAVMTN